MPVFSAAVKWSHWGIMELEAETEEDARHYIQFEPLPYLQQYIPESFEILDSKLVEVAPTIDTKGKLVMSGLPALLLGKDQKRKFAIREVKTAIDVIRNLGNVAGLSEHSVYEFKRLSEMMEEELKNEPRDKTEIRSSSAERQLQAS